MKSHFHLKSEAAAIRKLNDSFALAPRQGAQPVSCEDPWTQQAGSVTSFVLENWSLLFDLQILAMTLYAVWFLKNAY